MRIAKMPSTAAVAVVFALAGAVQSGAAAAAPASQAAGVAPCPGGYGPGPGMMGGAGWYGMGPSMMGGGRGMMRGRGYGTGMMMGAPGWAGALQLSDDQRAKVNRIADETRKAHWTLMGEMMDRQAKLRDLYEAPKRDDAAIDAAFKDIAAVRQKMFDTSADARKRMDAVLTDKQREQLRSYERDADAFGW